MSIDTLNISQLKKKIKHKLKHPFLDAHSERSEIDEQKLRILAYILKNNAVLTDDQKERYLFSVTLVQVALDTHEQVAVEHHPEKDPKEVVLRDQLRVLAGDYYSGLYYYFLADIEDYDFIQKLATSIKQINESKMKLYYKELETLDEQVAVVERIESLLYVSVAETVGCTELIPVIKQSLLLNRLLKEIDKTTKEETSNTDHQLFVHSRFSDTEPLESLYAVLQQTKEQLELAFTHLPVNYSDLQNECYAMLKETVYHNNQIAEEG